MSAPALEVVLIAATHSQAQHLAQTLRQVLHTLGFSPQLHTPELPTDLSHYPAQASHLLWAWSDSDPWRQALQELQRGYQVVHGHAEEALKQCMFALLPPKQAQGWARQPVLPRWQGVCETCGDAACEQRLFSRLLQS